MFDDNQGAIKLAENDAYRPRTKHIDVKYHALREKIENKTIILDFVETSMNMADSLTKAVYADKHIFCRTQMGLS